MCFDCFTKSCHIKVYINKLAVYLLTEYVLAWWSKGRGGVLSLTEPRRDGWAHRRQWIINLVTWTPCPDSRCENSCKSADHVLVCVHGQELRFHIRIYQIRETRKPQGTWSLDSFSKWKIYRVVEISDSFTFCNLSIYWTYVICPLNIFLNIADFLGKKWKLLWCLKHALLTSLKYFGTYFRLTAPTVSF